MHILTNVNEDDSLTRLVIGDLSAAAATVEILETLGHPVEFGQGDPPERDRDELDRLNVVLDEIYNHLLSTKMGIDIPKPPRF